MKNWKINNKRINKIILFIGLLFFIGCINVREEFFRQGLTKQEIQNRWGRRPDRITYNPVKYNADEIWIYNYPDSSVDRYYFKNGELIKKEHVTYDVF